MTFRTLNLLSCSASLSLVLCIAGFAQTAPSSVPEPAVRIVKPEPSAVRMAKLPGKEKALLKRMPANAYHFGAVSTGDQPEAQLVTLEFAANTRITRIESTRDFKIETGSTCAEEAYYLAKTSCALLISFTPQGPGHRLGRLTITHDGAATPLVLSMLGYSYYPVISFTPGVITTVPASYASGKGVLNNARNLSVDGNDTLYVADTGNNLIRSMDSSGVFLTVSSGTLSAPQGVVADAFGQIYFTEPAQNALFQIYAYGPQFQLNGTTSSACTVAAPCSITAQKVFTPGNMSTDGYNRIFFVDGFFGAAEFISMSQTASYAHLNDPFTYQASTPGTFAVDTSDNLYSFWTNGGTCSIAFQTFSDAANYYSIYSKVAGGKTCGFSGDGGKAGNAEIGKDVAQIAFDVAGNLYFSDVTNNRVRRIDSASSIVSTIAGNGTAGYTGDGGRATSATLNKPTGVAVDSQGSVYVVSSAATGQVIRKVGPQGLVAFGNQSKGVASAAQLVSVTNTGNSSMILTNVVVTGPNAADFKIDNATTTCILTSGASLNSGQTCRIGVIFTPSVVGARQATLTLLDNTVNGSDSVAISGAGVLPSPTFKITAPANGSSFKSGTAVTFSASVTSTSGTQPTGTVQFKVDGANYGSAVTLSSTGTASTSVTGLTTTTHTLSATYSGNANYAAAGPISVTITVTPAAAVKFTSPLPTQTLRSKTAINLAVTVRAGTGPAPAGKVNFSVDGKSVGTATIASGKASVDGGVLAAGTHTLAAAYSGDQYHAPTRASERITVSP